ncbi:MAG: hypothetical protein FWE20_12695 [Defluviitaleaceae bacterium]|nr:hypothetical protein [Defluviitaleaceae bacterium]
MYTYIYEKLYEISNFTEEYMSNVSISLYNQANFTFVMLLVVTGSEPVYHLRKSKETKGKTVI